MEKPNQTKPKKMQELDDDNISDDDDDKEEEEEETNKSSEPKTSETMSGRNTCSNSIDPKKVKKAMKS
jgi:hypothetical protein